MADRLTCFICNEPMVKSKTSKPQGQAAHNKCRVNGAGRKHGASGYSSGCRCTTCREGKAAVMRAYVQKKTAADGVSPTSALKRKKRGVAATATWHCFICKEPLLKEPARGTKRPMHKACRLAAPRWVREGQPSPTVRAAQKRIAEAAAGTTGGNRIFVAGGCAWCGDYVVVAQGRYCSTKCRTAASFARKSRSGLSFKITLKDRKAIYERDGWVCQLCLKAVDKTERWPSNWSPTLDHIIPQSAVLVPDHSASNLRLAHLWCNAARGDGTNMTHEVFTARVSEMHELMAA